MPTVHAPAEARSIAAALRKGGDPKTLAARARAIADPYHAAWALFHLARDTPALRAEALALLRRVPQDWRRAELAGEAARHLEGDHASLEVVLDVVLSAEPSEKRSSALQEVANRLPRARIPAVLSKTLSEPGALDDAKTLLKAWASDPQGDVMPAIARADAETRARLLGYLHVQTANAPGGAVAFLQAVAAAREIEDNLEVLRYLATIAKDQTQLDQLIGAAKTEEDRVALLARLVASADRLGAKEQAVAYLEQARAALLQVPDEKTRQRLQANLEKAGARLTGQPMPAPERNQATQRIIGHLPPTPRFRPVLALHNGYSGGLKTPHIRAVARAAPLCAAYGLDLLLIGFPAPLERIVEQVERETRVGEGGEYARLLHAAARLRDVPREHHADPDAWDVRGTIVLTTPSPDPEKATDFTRIGRDPVVVMGLGPEGLPSLLLGRVPHHLEITGHGISLETATAMGIIAERLRALNTGP